MTLRIATWNVERKRPTSPKGAAAVARLRSEEPDIAVLTEAWVNHLDGGPGGDGSGGADPGRGHRAHSHAVPVPGHHDDERKVVMWSKAPWTDIDDVGHPDMPAGRYVAATTDIAPFGPVRVMGICIPWHMCDVRYGSKDAKPWQRHLEWLACFAELVAARDRTLPLVVAGDFNQRVPRIAGNKDAADALVSALGDLAVVTAGMLDGVARPGIDHIAVCPLLTADRVWGWPGNDGGIAMSDHSAAAADLGSSDTFAE